jgi:farnesyl-diphosphate farnesyltransferase
MPASVVTQKELTSLLKENARTFALTLRLLPKSIRQPLSLGYLLARASDTVADAGSIPRDRRRALLSELQNTLGGDAAWIWRPQIESGAVSPSEERLLISVPRLMEALHQSDDREELGALWQSVLRGQIFDLCRFAGGADPLTLRELEEYCWQVAGSVGVTWTRLILKHAPGILPAATEGAEEMEAWGGAYGKGLQMINILRDGVMDREMGRYYFKEEALPIMFEKASGWLEQGKRYCEHLAPGRIRYATEMPLRLALKTLGQLQKPPRGRRVKISRGEVIMLLVKSLPSLGLRGRRNRA